MNHSGKQNPPPYTLPISQQQRTSVMKKFHLSWTLMYKLWAPSMSHMQVLYSNPWNCQQQYTDAWIYTCKHANDHVFILLLRDKLAYSDN
jgi:hypothetical protein